MKTQRSKSDSRAGTTHLKDGPPALTVIEAMEERRRIVIFELRDLTLSLEGVEERTVFDGFCREWTPAYYVGRTQLYHIHNFRSGLRLTMFVGVNTLGPRILEAEEVSPEARLSVAKISKAHGTGMLRMPLASSEDVSEFWGLVRVKWAFASSPVRRPPARNSG